MILLLALLLFLLFRSLPQNVLVPKVVGEPSAFKAEEKLTKAELKLDPNQKEKVDDKVAGGHRDRPDARRGRQGREGPAGHDPDRRRLGQGQRAQHRRA